MFHPRKPYSRNLSNLVLNQHFLRQQLRGNSPDLRYKNKDFDQDDDNSRSRSQNQKGHVRLLKSRGQHLLTNPRVLDAIVRNSHINPTDTVMEIGPGTGNLTLKLLEAAQKVIAIEIDKRMVEIVQERAAERGLDDRLTVIQNDALKTEFPRFDLVVANIPYGISSPLVAKLVFGVDQFRSATLLLQKEFARRLLADPGDSEFNRLAVNVKLVADVEFVMNVSKKDFLPQPKVDSSVVKIYPKAQIPLVNLDEWWAFTRICFSKKNKTLGATFKQKRKLMELMKLVENKGLNVTDDIDCCDHQHDGGDDEFVVGEDDIKVASDSLGGLSLFRDKVIDILRSGGFEDKRPSKLSHDELLHLLSLFNQSEIFFHGQAKPTTFKQC